MSARLPLLGRRVMVTRPLAQAEGMGRAIAELGGEPIYAPTICIADAEDPEELLSTLRRVEGFDWVVLTSVNAVDRFFSGLQAAGRDVGALDGVSVAAIGPSTAAALADRGVTADLIPERYVLESVAEALAKTGGLSGKRILLPRADVARAVLPELLRAQGAVVEEVTAYRVLPDLESAQRARAALGAGGVDYVTFTAGSAVRGFVEAVGRDLKGARTASIGPITSAALRERGMTVDVEAREHTIAGLLETLCEDACA